jgi:septum formation protein
MGNMLILASASPRRHEILLRAGIKHTVQPTNVPEDRLPNEAPVAFVHRIAEQKARAAVCDPGDVVLGADTVVVVDGEILGKPIDANEAIRMLRLLSGREHVVHTGICLVSHLKVIRDSSATRVRFVELTDKEMEDYVQSGEPFDKAGGYAIQGLASKFVSAIHGCYYNVVGLPISLVYSYLK